MLPQKFVLLMLVAVFAAATPCAAGTNAYVGQQQVANAASMDGIDHSSWGELLAKYVDVDGGVNYRDWKASSDDQQKLGSYLDHLSTADPKLSSTREAALAYWINVYNALTIEGMLRVYPTSSIRNHTAKVFGYNIWDDLQLYVGGTPYSLNQVEHEVLRKMGEPRIHFAIVCASKSCPRLLNEAYIPDRLDQQLDANAKHFFAQKNNFDVIGNTVVLSSILDWFNADFGDTDSKLLQRISVWLPETKRQSLFGKAVTISYSDYDWSINEAAVTK